MARMDWDADRGRRMVAPQRREAAARFMDWIIEARTGPVIPEPVKKRKRRNNAKPWQTQKPKTGKQRRAKSPPPRNKMRVDKREQGQAQKRRWVTLERRPRTDIEHLGADMALALRD